MILLGLDDATLVGAPQEMVVGNLADLRQPDAVIIDEAGSKHLWPDEPLRPGKTFEMNDRRAVIVGICKASAHVSDVPDRLHPLQPGRAASCRASASCCRSSWPSPQPGRARRRSLPPHRRADRPAGR